MVTLMSLFIQRMLALKLNSTSGSETTQVTEESITQVTEENEATESEVNGPEEKASSFVFIFGACK
jgi:hypothetical protein